MVTVYMHIKKIEYLYILVLIALSLFLRYVTMPQSDISYSFDTGNYILSLEDYSIQDHRPHTPGYFLFIKLLELASYFTDSSYSAYFFLSNLFIALSVPFLYLLLRFWISYKETVFIVLIFLTNPIVWFYANVPETYPFDVLFSLSLVYCGINRKYSYLILPIIALGSGVRISSGVLMLPVAIFFLWKSYRDKSISFIGISVSLIAAIMLFLIWFIPMISITGGFDVWYRLMATHNPYPDSRETFSLISIMKNSFYVFLYIFFFVAPALISYIFLSSKKHDTILNKDIKQLIITSGIWSLPGLLFFIFYYYVKGYLLLLAGAFFLLLAIPLTRKKVNIFVIVTALGLQFAYFFYFPYHDPGLEYHYKSLRDELSTKELVSKRSMSDLSFTHAQLSYLNDRYDDVSKAIDWIISDLDVTDKIILIDPSVNVFARSFQPKYPEIKFAEIPPAFTDNFQIFYGTESKTLDGFKDVLPKMIIISTKKSDEKFFSGMKISKKSINDLTISTIRAKKNENIYEMYLSLCK
jgi:hypothetical protein